MVTRSERIIRPFQSQLRRWLILIAAVEVLVLGGLAARRWTTGAAPTIRHPDVILITIDALRADHLGVYGYDRPTSPNLDALAREAVVVRDHIAQAPFTKASMASLFTGLFPTSHKAYTISRTFSQTMTGSVQGTLPVTDVLDASLWRLASAFQSAGYQTIGLATNPFLLREFGFGAGFSDYEFLADGDNFAPADQVLGRAIERFDKRAQGRPLFLWVHLMEPHSPYTPPKQFRDLFPPRTPPRPVPLDVIPAWIVQNESADANFYESLYNAEIRTADASLGTFFSALRARGEWDHLALVVTADHGEEFFDHGGFEHNRTLYEEMVHVPLIVKAPGLGAGMRDVQTQAVDVAPTLAHLAGVDPQGTLRGRISGLRFGEPGRGSRSRMPSYPDTYICCARATGS